MREALWIGAGVLALAARAQGGDPVVMTWKDSIINSDWNLVVNWLPPKGKLPSVPDTPDEAASFPDLMGIGTTCNLDIDPTISHFDINNPEATIFLHGHTITAVGATSTNSGLIVANTGTCGIGGSLVNVNTIEIDQAATLVMTGPNIFNLFSVIMVNTGTGGAGPAILRIEGNVTFQGILGGNITLNAGAEDARLEVAPGFTMTNTDHLIQGAGMISGTVHNAGTIAGASIDMDTNGGSFVNSGQATLATLAVAALTVTSSGDLTVLGAVTHTGGTITVDGTLDAVDGVSLADGSTLRGTGQVIASVDNQAATVGPGGSVGTLSVDSYVQGAGGRLLIELAGTNSGEFDVLAVDGSASVDGELRIEAVSGMVAPVVGQTYMVLTTGTTLSGTFNAITPEWGTFSVSYANDEITVTVDDWPPCADQDVNNDGQVGIQDFLAVIGTWGACPEPCPPCLGDTDGDCTVGITDFLGVIGNWGIECW